MGCHYLKCSNQDNKSEIITIRQKSNCAKNSNNDTTSNIHNSQNNEIKETLLYDNKESYSTLIKTEIKKKESNDMIINRTFYEYDSFPLEFITLLNKIRANPKGFVQVIKEGQYQLNTKTVLREAILFLENCQPMKNLQLNKSICLNFPNSFDNNTNNTNYINKQIASLPNINSYWAYQVKIPQLALLLLLISDPSTNQNKRNDLLNPHYQYVGISTIQQGSQFVSYFTFSF